MEKKIGTKIILEKCFRGLFIFILFQLLQEIL